MSESSNPQPSPLDLLRQVDVVLQGVEPQAALTAVLQMLLPQVCQQATLSVVEGDGSSSLVTAFVDPELERLAIEVHRRYPPKPTLHLSEVAARTGETLLRDVTEELMASIAHDAEHLAMLRRFAATQLLVMPLRRRHRVLGVLALSTDGGRRFGAEHRSLVELLATRIAIHLDTDYFPRRVLVVDDNPAHRYMLGHSLVRAGFEVGEAGTGAEALQLARHAKPDAIILDVNLPDMLGFEVCRQLKTDEQTARIPIIQLSAEFTGVEAPWSARAYGADDFLVAPVEAGKLVAKLKSVLRASEVQVESRRSLDRERLARLELERAYARLRAITESGMLGTVEWDSDGVLINANEGFLKMVGHRREDVLSRRLRLSALFVGEAEASDPPSESLALERDLVSRDGKRVSVLFGKAPMPELPGGGVAFVLDVSEQRRRAELEALLVGIVSHDLRNPLGIVTMGAALLQSQELPTPQRDIVRRIDAAGRKAVRLIADLLDFTVARGGGIPLSRDAQDVHEVVAQAAEDLRSTWPGRVIVHVRVSDGVAHIDPARVEQIASNLIGNALQHSPASTPVRIETRGDVESVFLTVQNQGQPIAPDLLEQLFHPLRRGVTAGARRGSIGLGLFIVQHLVEAHGGTISVASNEAEGTCFSVRLPRERDDDALRKGPASVRSRALSPF